MIVVYVEEHCGFEFFKVPRRISTAGFLFLVTRVRARVHGCYLALKYPCNHQFVRVYATL